MIQKEKRVVLIKMDDPYMDYNLGIQALLILSGGHHQLTDSINKLQLRHSINKPNVQKMDMNCYCKKSPKTPWNSLRKIYFSGFYPMSIHKIPGKVPSLPPLEPEQTN